MLKDLLHLQHNHEGVDYVKSVIQRKVWILGLRSALRIIKINCVLCHEQPAEMQTPLIADIQLDLPILEMTTLSLLN